MQRSLSSPDLHARLRKANANERAALAPTLASPVVARLLAISVGLGGTNTHWIVCALITVEKINDVIIIKLAGVQHFLV